MQNQISNIENISSISQSNLFDLLVECKPQEAVERIAKLETFIKNAKATLEEAKAYIAGEVGESIEGENYQLTTNSTNNYVESYNPNMIFNKIKSNESMSIEFLNLVKVNKKDVIDLIKSNNLKVKDFNDCLERTEKETKINYKIRLKK
jgi:hypothetical protein